MKRRAHKYICSSFICYNPKLETTQMSSIGERRNQLDYQWNTTRNKKEWTIDTSKARCSQNDNEWMKKARQIRAYTVCCDSVDIKQNTAQQSSVRKQTLRKGGEMHGGPKDTLGVSWNVHYLVNSPSLPAFEPSKAGWDTVGQRRTLFSRACLHAWLTESASTSVAVPSHWALAYFVIRQSYLIQSCVQ